MNHNYIYILTKLIRKDWDNLTPFEVDSVRHRAENISGWAAAIAEWDTRNKLLTGEYADVIIDKLLETLNNTSFLGTVMLSEEEKQNFITKKRAIREALKNMKG